MIVAFTQPNVIQILINKGDGTFSDETATRMTPVPASEGGIRRIALARANSGKDWALVVTRVGEPPVIKIPSPSFSSDAPRPSRVPSRSRYRQRMRPCSLTRHRRWPSAGVRRALHPSPRGALPVRGEERPATQLNLGIALRIDESYVPEENQRLRLYKKIAGASSEGAVAEVRAEMEDRYGAPPDATVYLLEAAMVRLECERMGIAQVDRKRGELQIRFMENAVVDPQTLMRLVAKNAKRGAQFTPQGLLKYPLAATRPDEVLLEIHDVLARLAPAPVNA